MLQSTETLIQHQLDQHVIRDSDLAHIFQGSDARRYALVNKALKKNELIRLCRGFYLLNHPQHQLFSRYYLANRIIPYSFVSAESALSFHGWIPERVTQVTSIAVFGRNKQFSTPFGSFVYRVPPIELQHTYLGVSLVTINQHNIYMASPLRALVDYMYWHKVKNPSIHFLIESLRIEKEHIQSIRKNEILELKNLYSLKAIKQFLEVLLNEVKHGKSNH